MCTHTHTHTLTHTHTRDIVPIICSQPLAPPTLPGCMCVCVCMCVYPGTCAIWTHLDTCQSKVEKNGNDV